MSALLDKLRGFFATNANWNSLVKKKFTFPPSVKTEEDPSESWDIVGDIGDGAFGKIYKVQNKENGTYAALKQVNVDDEADLNQYSVEVIILSELKHPNIVGLFEAYYYHSKFWMYLEYCAIGAVDNIIHDLEHGLNELQIQSIVKQMLIGLKFLHENGVIHRDLKAGNVLITSEGSVKLADFGVSAKSSSADQKRGTFIGTPYWMAPEVLACETTKENPYDLRADIWSFGITVIEFAQMEPPYNKMNPARVAIKIMRSDPPTLDQPKKWSADLNDFLSKCLQKEPSNRYLTSQLLEHSFLRNVEGTLPIMQLISEVKADVTIELCDIDSQDNLSSSLSNSNSSEDLLAGSSSPVDRSPASEKPKHASNEKVIVAEINSDSVSSKDDASKAVNGDADGHRNTAREGHDLSNDRSPVNGLKSVHGAKNDKNNRRVVDEEVQELSLSITDEDESLPSEPGHNDVSGWPSNGFHQGKFGTKPSQRLLMQTGAAATSTGYSVVPSQNGAASDSNFDRDSGRYRSLTKTRSYIYEGKVVTHRTSKVIVSGDENREQEDHETRKANFRAFKLLQFTENRKLEFLNQKFYIQKENVERQFEQELRENLQKCNVDVEQLTKSHKQEIEKLERKQTAEHRLLAKNMKDQQEKDLKAFQDSLKRELRNAKREASGLSKGVQRRQIDQKEVEFAESERKYREHQYEMMTKALARLTSKHRNAMAALEFQLLEEKHQLIRAYEGGLWGLEEKRLQQKTELLQQQIRQLFELHHELATFRHAQELEQVRRTHERDLAKLRQKLMADSKELVKRQKIQSRTEMQRLKEGFKAAGISVELEREKLREFDEKSKEKIRDETKKQDVTMKQRLDSFEREHLAYVTELKQLHEDRMTDLNEQLKQKLQNENLRHRSEIMDWQFNLSSRKQTLEEDFSLQMAEQRRFYSQMNVVPQSYRASSPPTSSLMSETTSSWMNSDNHVSTAL